MPNPCHLDAEAWNFGPDDQGNRKVSDVLEALRRHWPAADWTVSSSAQSHEAIELKLDSSKARQRLGWRPVWGFDEALNMTGAWYSAFLQAGEVRSNEQLETYLSAARNARLVWCEA